MFSLTKRKEERALKAKIQTKIGHLSNPLQAANAVLAEKDIIIASLRCDIAHISSSTAQTKRNMDIMQASLANTKKKLVTAEERTTAASVELAASAGHSPKFNQ